VKTGKLAGWTPEVHLNDEGKAQAAALGLRLATTRIDAIYSSPLERTVETANAILEHHPELQLQLLDDIGEVRYGTWQGQELGKLSQRKMWRVIQFTPSRARFPNGEAMRDSQMRAVNALEMLAERHPGQHIAVVSHSDIIKMIMAHYLGMHLDLFQRIEISPASLTIIGLGFGRPTIVQMNETSYLPQRKHDEVHTVTSLVIDAVGEPGSRVFYLQAEIQPGESHGSSDSGDSGPIGKFLWILLEKTQAMEIAGQIEAVFNEASLEPTDALALPALLEPESVLFRAGKLAVKYDKDADRIDLEIEELRGEGQGTPQTLRLRATRQQMYNLGRHTSAVVQRGRV
jgi:probable phosphomutase (TIGR03848 family)